MEKILYLANSQNAAGAFRHSKEIAKMIGEAKVETFRVQARARGSHTISHTENQIPIVKTSL